MNRSRRLALVRDYLMAQGYKFTQKQVEEILDIYEDGQEWNENTMTTGNSYDELGDWLRHTSTIDEIIG